YVGVVFFFKREGRDLIRSGDELSQHRLRFHELCVWLDRIGAWHAVDQRSDICSPADLFELTRAAQFIAERDQIDGHQLLDQRDHLFEDSSMRIEKEVFAAKQLDRLIADKIVEKDRAEY